MAGTAITPTRMVLNQLKGRLKTARRGHKLLKDKRDELMRQFLDIVRRNKVLRAEVEQNAASIAAAFENQLDALYSAEVLDIGADLDVLQSMMKGQGL